MRIKFNSSSLLNFLDVFQVIIGVVLDDILSYTYSILSSLFFKLFFLQITIYNTNQQEVDKQVKLLHVQFKQFQNDVIKEMVHLYTVNSPLFESSLFRNSRLFEVRLLLSWLNLLTELKAKTPSVIPTSYCTSNSKLFEANFPLGTSNNREFTQC